jgi:hypothetical protein
VTVGPTVVLTGAAVCPAAAAVVVAVITRIGCIRIAIVINTDTLQTIIV